MLKYEGDIRKAQDELKAYLQTQRARARGRAGRRQGPAALSARRTGDGRQDRRVHRAAARQRPARLDGRAPRRLPRRRRAGRRRPPVVQGRAARGDGEARRRRAGLRRALRPLLLRPRRGRPPGRERAHGRDAARAPPTSSSSWTGWPRSCRSSTSISPSWRKALLQNDTGRLEQMLREAARAGQRAEHRALLPGGPLQPQHGAEPRARRACPRSSIASSSSSAHADLPPELRAAAGSSSSTSACAISAR